MNMTPVTVLSRPMRDDADFWKMRDLLIQCVSITPVGLNWDMRRLDGKRFYNEDNEENRLLNRPVQLWEDSAGRLLGYVLPEGKGDAYVQIHPDYRCIEDEMIAWAEEHLAAPAGTEGRLRLEFYVCEYDVLRQRLLAGRGFAKTEDWGIIRHMRLGRQPLTKPHLAEGYILRETRPEDLADCQRIADLLNAAFRRNFHNALEYQNFTRQAPSFRRELDLVAEAPDGTFGAYVAIPYDGVNRWGIVEPVCTHPEHRRKGLAQALLQEGFLRLRDLGGLDVSVDTGDMVPANALYDSLGFTEAYKSFAWVKSY
jgi:ribosomal protein S18 acetylase RimI-like enzyme